MYEIECDGDYSLNILDVRESFILFMKNAFTLPPQLVIGKFDPLSTNVANINLIDVTQSLKNPGLENYMFDLNEFVYDNDDSISKVSRFLNWI